MSSGLGGNQLSVAVFKVPRRTPFFVHFIFSSKKWKVVEFSEGRFPTT